MNKYKLINKQTGEEHLCDKAVIDGWDYYVKDELPQKNDKILCDERNHITENPKYKIRTCKSIVNDWIMTFEIDGQGENPNWTKKIIATNNPNIDIPKVVDEVAKLAGDHCKYWEFERLLGSGSNGLAHDSFIFGYNKSQETHPFTEEDMKSFLIFSIEYRLYNGSEGVSKTSNELLQLWKEQRPKTLYYE